VFSYFIFYPKGGEAEIRNIIKNFKAIEERKLNMKKYIKRSKQRGLNMHIFHCGEKRCWKAKTIYNRCYTEIKHEIQVDTTKFTIVNI
jgi:hypothetical protein